MLFLFLLVMVLVIVVIASTGDEKRKRLEAAWQAYQQSLTQLKKRPTDPDLKQRTLALGRAYSNLTREQKGQKGVTLFDEVALSNDIAAACAAATLTRPATIAAAAAPSPEERLSRLASLRDRSLISDEEYGSERRRILSEI